jgi:hypothetical protein
MWKTGYIAIALRRGEGRGNRFASRLVTVARSLLDQDSKFKKIFYESLMFTVCSVKISNSIQNGLELAIFLKSKNRNANCIPNWDFMRVSLKWIVKKMKTPGNQYKEKGSTKTFLSLNKGYANRYGVSMDMGVSTDITIDG